MGGFDFFVGLQAQAMAWLTGLEHTTTGITNRNLNRRKAVIINDSDLNSWEHSPCGDCYLQTNSISSSTLLFPVLDAVHSTDSGGTRLDNCSGPYLQYIQVS
jgi:hypothetical protein